MRHVRLLALKRLRRQIAIACDDDTRSRVVDRVARLALAAIDGAFVAASADRSARSPRSSSRFPTRSLPLGEHFS